MLLRRLTSACAPPSEPPIRPISIALTLVAGAAQQLEVRIGEGELWMRLPHQNMIDVQLVAVGSATTAALAAAIMIAQKVIAQAGPKARSRKAF
jgi:hypothetical protein